MDEACRAVLELELAALDRWIQGDSMGFAELAGEGMTYCEPFLLDRLDGREAFVAHMTAIRGQVRADRYELRDPVFHHEGDLVVMSFRFRSWVGERAQPWMATSVYRRTPQGWRQMHSHWSQPLQG